jgi:ubiquinone/menaquinone biosynthesis C-methylase UbiE
MATTHTGLYLLGANQDEFDRLQFQHAVWKQITDQFLDRVGVGRGWTCLDAGAGPGFVTFDLRERVGETGSVTALEPSDLYYGWCKDQIERQGWTNVTAVHGTAENASLPAGTFDFIFVRWVIAFVADPERFLASLLPLLKPTGVIAFQDYYYEGLSLFPRGGAFDRMADGVRKYYASVGGDPYITGKIPVWLRANGYSVTDYTPHARAGGPKSEIMEWAHRFFTKHIPHMVEKGSFSAEEGTALLNDWNSHRENPDTLFFAPIVVDVAGRKK